MRKGVNPAKLENNKVENESFHQVIVPVYLPNLEGYYKEGLEILKLCLESIYLTVHDKTYISVVNNGSCEEVKVFLDELLKLEKIQEVIHTSAIGKINAIAKGLAGHNFDLVTITDADVLFTNDWQKAVYEIYETFPKAGMVGTTPNPLSISNFTEMIFFDNILNSNMRFYNISKSTGNAIDCFFKSIGWKGVKSTIQKNKAFAIKKDNVLAIIGSGHFTATYKTELLAEIKIKTAKAKAGGPLLHQYIDAPSIKYGHWRLATFHNYTFHMGNHSENWMMDLIKMPKQNFSIATPQLKKYQSNLPVLLIRKLLNKYFFKKALFKKYLSKKGLSNDEVSEFLL